MGKKINLPPEVEERACRMYEAGEKTKDIASACGITPQYLQEVVNRNGLEKRRSYRTLDMTYRIRGVAKTVHGFTVREACDFCEDWDRVCRRLRKEGA